MEKTSDISRRPAINDAKITVRGIAVVILNWNGKGFLEKFLPALLHSVEHFNGQNAKTSAEVIVADNASTDGSMEMMAEKFPVVKTIVLDRNYGFTGGYNKAFEKIESEYFLLINSDIEVPEEWLTPLFRWMERHPDCGACSPKLHSWQEKDMFEYAGAAGGLLDRFGYPFCRGRVMKRLEKDEGQYDTPADVFWATGACLMIRSSLYLKLGGLDGRFFAHMEEIDLCWRAQLNGWKITVVPQSTVWHIGGGTLPQDSPWKLFLNFRNNLLMLDNNLARTCAIESLAGKGFAAYADDEATEATGRADRGKEADATINNGRPGTEIPDITRLSRKAARKARRTIFTRMLLDGCSAMAYLLSFHPRYFLSVLKAHNEFRRLRKGISADEVRKYLESLSIIPAGSRTVQAAGSRPRHIEIRGLHKRWIIPKALFKTKND